MQYTDDIFNAIAVNRLITIQIIVLHFTQIQESDQTFYYFLNLGDTYISPKKVL